MAKVGEVIENPVTGERITFVETAADSGGERLRIHLGLSSTAHNAGTHLHAKQEERIAISRGELKIIVGNDEVRTLRAGEEVLLAPGVPHVWWNESGAPAEVEIEYQPALNTEEFFESFFALGRDGKTDPQGKPRFMQLVTMVRHYELYDGKAPVWLQRTAGALLAPIAHALGYRPYYVEQGSKAAPRLGEVPVSH